jgi:hypothetical protein
MAKKKVESEVLERFDPDPADGDSEIDGDIRYELMLADDTLPPDLHPVWVAQNSNPALDCVKEYRHAGYREVRFGEGIQMKSGMAYQDGEVMTFRDHVLMVADKAKHDARERRQRKFNADVRAKMIKKNNAPLFVTNPNDR